MSLTAGRTSVLRRVCRKPTRVKQNGAGWMKPGPQSGAWSGDVESVLRCWEAHPAPFSSGTLYVAYLDVAEGEPVVAYQDWASNSIRLAARNTTEVEVWED
jgi:hypothetical protein